MHHSAIASSHDRVGGTRQPQRSTALLPCLSELTIINLAYDVIVLPVLPASVTYFHLACQRRMVSVQQQAAGSDPIELELTAALPPSLVCLSLALPATAFTNSLLSAIPRQCPRMTHCHVSKCTDWNNDTAVWEEKLQLLREQLDAGVWCDTVAAVERQRLDQCWKREVGVEMLQY